MDIIAAFRRWMDGRIASRMAAVNDRIISLSARHKRLPLKEPFETAKRRAEASDTVIVELVTKSGVVGLGAATPVQYVTGETVESVVSAVNEAERALAGSQVTLTPEITVKIGELLSEAPSARAGVEMALVDAMGKILRTPVYELFDGAPISIETDVTIPVVPPEHAGELAAQAAERGFRFFKVKVSGRNPEDDLTRASAISRAVADAGLIVDANQGFAPDEAVSFVRRLRETGADVVILEQPVDRSDIEGLAYVTRSVDVPVFADESASTPSDVLRLAESNAVAGVNVKLMKSGFFGALEVAAAAKALGLELMLGCMLEPRVGISAAIHLACIARDFKHFDLDADLLLAEDGTSGYVRNGAWIRPIKSPGLGCLPEP